MENGLFVISTDFVEKFKSFFFNTKRNYYSCYVERGLALSEKKTHCSQIVFKFFDQHFVNFI